LAAVRRLAARRRDARLVGAGAGGLRGPGLRHSRRRQAAGPAGAASSADPGAERGDRGPERGRRAGAGSRSASRTPLVQPTARALFVLGLAGALGVRWVLAFGDWWEPGVALPLTALLALGVDFVLAPPRRGVAVDVRAPDVLSIGGTARLAVSAATR